MKSRRRLVILDPQLTGHHAAYICRIASAASEKGMDVLVVSSQGFASSYAYASLAEEVRSRIELATIERQFFTAGSDSNGFVRLFWFQIRWWFCFRTLTLSVVKDRDIVMLPYADTVTYAMSVFGSPFKRAPFMAISMRPPFSESSVQLIDRAKEILFRRFVALPALHRLFLIDKRAAQRYAAGSSKTIFLPDPVDPTIVCDRDAARKALRLAPDAVVMLVYGASSKRKGLSMLLELMDRPLFPDALHVVVAGQQDEDVRAMFAAWREQTRFPLQRVTLIDQTVSRQMEAELFTASDILWLLYRGHQGMSGVMVQGAQYELASLVTDHGLMGWYAKEMKVGLAVPPDSPDLALSALHSLVGNPNLRTTLARTAKGEFASHTLENFTDVIFRELQTLATG